MFTSDVSEPNPKDHLSYATATYRGFIYYNGEIVAELYPLPVAGNLDEPTMADKKAFGQKAAASLNFGANTNVLALRNAVNRQVDLNALLVHIDAVLAAAAELSGITYDGEDQHFAGTLGNLNNTVQALSTVRSAINP